MTNIAESYPPPPKKFSPTPRSLNFFLVGPGTHFYQNQLKFASFKFFHRLSISEVNNGLLTGETFAILSLSGNTPVLSV